MDGQTRDGRELSREKIDINGDDVLSMYEAHLYTLQTAVSVDLSRSTSEIYLEKWEPWYIRWLSFIPGGRSVYAEIARELAVSNNLWKEQDLSIALFRERQQELQQQLGALEKEKKSIKDDIKKIQEELQLELRLRWPAIYHPYTWNYGEFLKNSIEPFVQFIMKHRKFSQLVRLQDCQETRNKEILTTKRQLIQFDKILRMRKLARLQYFFGKYASDLEKEEYRRLLQCEQEPF